MIVKSEVNVKNWRAVCRPGEHHSKQGQGWQRKGCGAGAGRRGLNAPSAPALRPFCTSQSTLTVVQVPGKPRPLLILFYRRSTYVSAAAVVPVTYPIGFLFDV